MAALWRLLPVTTLTVRQFTGGRTARLALVLSLIPALFAAIYVVRPWGVTPTEFTIDLFRELIVPTLLPIVVLLPATAAFGNELEDGTLPYLLMKPVSRLRLVLGKYLAVLLVTIPALLIGLALTTLIASRGPDAGDLGRVLMAMAGASAAAAALLGAVFLLVSLIIPRALLAGMIYIFAWESLLGRFLPGVQAISSREHALRVFDGILDADFATASNAALTMLVFAVACLLLAVWRLQSIQVD
ncbi:MAG TPA: ABC transporter permease subunit [Thermomicrobiales bacterium]|nr:ABC transporter permease subunit [Thermomicrobiales bacterium]